MKTNDMTDKRMRLLCKVADTVIEGVKLLAYAVAAAVALLAIDVLRSGC